jgi:hypothetical protein
MSELSKVDIYRQIDVLRQSLLDLTMRNQLLNFRARAMTVEVKEGDLAEIYDRLVIKQSKRKLLQFIPRQEIEPSTLTEEVDTDLEKEVNNTSQLSDSDELPSTDREMGFSVDKGTRKIDKNITPTDASELVEDNLEAGLSEDLSIDSTQEDSFTDSDNISETLTISDTLTDSEEGVDGEEPSILWDSPALDQETLEKNKEIFLSTDLTPSELQRRLFYINQRARSMMEEQGYNILYLAMGFLRWKENNGTPGYREAPLILIPVELERKRVKGSFKLHWTGEDIIANISLQA